MARKIIRGVKSPGPAPERMEQPMRNEPTFLGLGSKQVPYETPEYLAAEQQYSQWAAAHQAYEDARNNNRLVGQRTRLMNDAHIPTMLRNDITRGIADNIVDGTYQNAVNSAVAQGRRAAPYALAAGGGLTAVAGAAGLAEAYYDQTADGLPTDPLAVIGRSISNAGGVNVAVVGTDPLASARLNVQQAQQSVGSDAVLEALVVDQLAGQSQADQVFDQQVSAMVDARAAQLQGTPIQNSDGTTGPMDYDTAIRLAQAEVSLQLRAEGIV